MKIERFEQAHQLAEGQLVVDAKGELWKAIHYLGEVQLIGFEGVENAFIVDQSGQGRPLGPEDDAPLPWLTVKVVPDDGLPRPVLDPCPVCGKADWPEGGMHAARSIHLRGHERQAEHLQVSTSDRGFNRLPPIPSEYGGSVRVYESSAAMGPHIWLTAEAPANLNEPDGPKVKAPIHLTVESALKLADQIRLLCRGHYQVPVTSSTMCGGCGDMQQLMSDASFVPHTSRRTGEPCPGEPGIPTADAAARWRQFCAGLDQPELWR